MLNTGLSLRKPYESLYGAYRRFLVANPGIPIKKLKDALRVFEEPSEYKEPGRYAVLAQRQEAQFCKLNRIPYVSPEFIPINIKIRNCAMCAATGYHSSVFQWNWLSQCPIHHVPLTWNCPTCCEPWPTFKDLIHRRCETCGWPTSLECLRANTAFTSPCNLIEELKFIESEFNSLKVVELHTHPSFTYALNCHSPITINQKHFASIVSVLFPKYRRTFIANKVPLQKVLKFSFRNTINRHRRSRSYLRNVEQLIKKKVAARILDTVAKKRNSTLAIPSTLNIEYEGIDKNTDCYLFAYLYWRKLINDVPGAGIHRNHYSRYFDFGTATFPLIPVPLNHIKFKSENEIEPSDWSDRLAPIDLQCFIYELDLWWCYKGVLKYFDTLKTHRERNSWHQFYDALPEWAWPGRDYNDGSVIVCNTANTFDLYLPYSVLKLTFDDLELSE